MLVFQISQEVCARSKGILPGQKRHMYFVTSLTVLLLLLKVQHPPPRPMHSLNQSKMLGGTLQLHIKWLSLGVGKKGHVPRNWITASLGMPICRLEWTYTQRDTRSLEFAWRTYTQPPTHT